MHVGMEQEKLEFKLITVTPKRIEYLAYVQYSASWLPWITSFNPHPDHFFFFLFLKVIY